MLASTLHFSFSLVFILALFSEVWAGDLRDGSQKNGRGGAGGVVKGPKINKGVIAPDSGKMFRLADMDHDRRLTFAEFENVKRLRHMDSDKRRKLFVFLDHDKDGFLQIGELYSPVAKWAKGARKSFVRFDQNKDGGLNISEFSEMMKLSSKHIINPEHLFQRLDRNKSGVIEPEELSAKPRLNKPYIDFMAYDKNGSGGVDYSEYSQIPLVCKWPDDRRKQLFQRIDADFDGELTKLEISRMPLKRGRGPDIARPEKRGLLRSQ